MTIRHVWPVLLVLGLALPACNSKSSEEQPGCRMHTPSSAGPGDVGSHFPIATANHWLYDVVTMTGGSETERYLAEVAIIGTRDDGASVFEFRPGNGDPVTRAVFAKGPSGVTQLSDGSEEPPLDAVFPNMLLEWPLEAGRSFEQVSCTGLTTADLDGDGRGERLDLRSVVTVVGEETVGTQVATFEAMKVETVITLTIRASGGGRADAQGQTQDWYAPGVGLVRSRTTTVLDGREEVEERTLAGWVADTTRGGVTARATLTAGAPMHANSGAPGDPALAFDGSGHLLVTIAAGEFFGNDSLQGLVLGPTGSPGLPFPVSTRLGYGLHPAAAFNGTNHLVVSCLYGNAPSGTYALYGQRVTPAGAALDGPEGITISATGSTKYWPAVASDGSDWAVTWNEYPAGLLLAHVSGAGQVGAALPLSHANTGFPKIAYGGGVYLVVWTEGTHVLAARIAPGGPVLDGAPLMVSSTSPEKYLGGVAFDGTRFLITWVAADAVAGDGSPRWDVHAARVLPNGSVVDPAAGGGLTVNAYPGQSKSAPQVAVVDGTFVLSWVLGGFGPEAGIYVVRMLGDGTLLYGPVDGTGLRVASVPAEPALAPTAAGDVLVVWVETHPEGSGTTASLEAAWLAPPYTLPDGAR